MKTSARSTTGPNDDDAKKKIEENEEEEPGMRTGNYAQPDLDIGEGDELSNRAQ